MITIRAIINQARNQVALSNYDFDLNPDEDISSVYQLDGMMGDWAANYFINIGYMFYGTPSPDSDSGISIGDFQTVYLNLAVLIISSLGGTASQELLSRAGASFSALKMRNTYQIRKPLPGVYPVGAGNIYRDQNAAFWSSYPGLNQGGTVNEQLQ